MQRSPPLLAIVQNSEFVAHASAPSLPLRTLVRERISDEVPRLRQYARRQFGEARGLEVAQDAVVKALERAHTYDHERPIWPWLKVIADRCAVREFERCHKAPRGLENPNDLPAHQSTCIAREDVESLLSRLEATDEHIVRRHHLDGESVADLAKSLDTPEGTLKARLWRARRRLAIFAGAAGLAVAVLLMIRTRHATSRSTTHASDVRESRTRLLSSSLTVTRFRAEPPKFATVALNQDAANDRVPMWRPVSLSSKTPGEGPQQQ